MKSGISRLFTVISLGHKTVPAHNRCFNKYVWDKWTIAIWWSREWIGRRKVWDNVKPEVGIQIKEGMVLSLHLGICLVSYILHLFVKKLACFAVKNAVNLNFIGTFFLLIHCILAIRHFYIIDCSYNSIFHHESTHLLSLTDFKTTLNHLVAYL